MTFGTASMLHVLPDALRFPRPTVLNSFAANGSSDVSDFRPGHDLDWLIGAPTQGQSTLQKIACITM